LRKKETDVQTVKYNLISISYYVFYQKKKSLLILYFLLTDLKTPSAMPFTFIQENTLL